MRQDDAGANEGIEFRLVVRASREAGWSASVFGPDATRREFASPFELARFLAWPLAQPPASNDGGIR